MPRTFDRAEDHARNVITLFQRPNDILDRARNTGMNTSPSHFNSSNHACFPGLTDCARLRIVTALSLIFNTPRGILVYHSRQQ